MALRFPRFSQGLAQDPTTRIWFGIATAHDFESHDDITEERLYQTTFALSVQLIFFFFFVTSELVSQNPKFLGREHNNGADGCDARSALALTHLQLGKIQSSLSQHSCPPSFKHSQ
jgi:photosystem I P700 chlorophyll a apoprotein A2